MHDDRESTQPTGASDWPGTSLVPPRRLGSLLSAARSRKADTLEDLADRSLGRFSLATLSSIERGSRPVDDDEARVLADIYDLESSSIVPPRSKLIVDLDEGMLTVDDRHLRVGRHAPSRDEVLTRYLTLVYSMRHVDPGEPLTLRVDDLDVLGRALRLGTETVEADLEALMAHPEMLSRWRSRSLSRRVLIPAAGVMVALLGVGALLLVEGSPDADAGTAPNPAATAVSNRPQAGPISVPTDIGSAVVQERLADGTAGPVVVRNGDAAPSSTADAAPADVGLIAPESTVRSDG